MTTQKPPATLGREGKKLWRSLTDGIEYRPDELAILESACSMADLIREYEVAVRDEPLTVRGSAGQEVLHPIRAEIRALRMSQAQLLGRLDVPEADDEGVEEPVRMTRQQAAKKAAAVRWGKA